MLGSHAVDPGSYPGSGRILTGTPLVESCQSNVMSTISERLTYCPSGLNVCSCYEAENKIHYNIIKTNAF